MNAHRDSTNASDALTADALGLQPLIDVAELAAYLGVPVSTIYDWRTHGKGRRLTALANT